MRRVFVLPQQVEKDIQGVVAALWLELLEQIAAYALDQRELHSENYAGEHAAIEISVTHKSLF